MTQSSYFLTNGSSLEDCHTNFFALADLCGIKWRQYSCDQHFNDLNEDPILKSFTNCINANLLCVWRRVRNHNTQEQTTRDLYISYSKELWIFWYEDEPDLKELISGQLKEGEQGSWESGLSYECRTLLFKALHNLIERCLLSKGYCRLGQWFFHNKNREISDILKEGIQVTFRFNFFLHGDSSVCANVDVRQHLAVRPLTKEDILNAQQIPDGLQVLLSPFGLQGILTGSVYKENDPNLQKFLSDWNKIYPLSSNQSKNIKGKTTTFANTFSAQNFNNIEDLSEVSNKVCEVIVGNCRMKYPMNYLFITEADLEVAKFKFTDQQEKINKTCFSETFNQIIKQYEENLSQIKLKSQYHYFSPNDTYLLKNNFNQVMYICDQQANSNDNKLERNMKSENYQNPHTYELLLKKNCNCLRCQNPNIRKHSKSSSGGSSNNSSTCLAKNKNSDKDKSMRHCLKVNSKPFHHRIPMDLMHDLSSFHVFQSSTSLASNPIVNNNNNNNNHNNNIDSSPISANTLASINNNNNQTNVTPVMVPYKSPVSTSTSSILNTPGVESSPMSNFNIESHEHISPIPSKEDAAMMNTPVLNNSNNSSNNSTNINDNSNQIGSSPKDKSLNAFDHLNNSVNNICDSVLRNTVMGQTNNNLNNKEETINIDQQLQLQQSSSINNDMTDNHRLEKKHFKRSYRYKSIYDDDSTYRLRYGLLYDFSSETIPWEETPRKNRRFKPVIHSDDPIGVGGYADQNSLDCNRDPYDFCDLDNPDYVGSSMKFNPDLLESSLAINVNHGTSGGSDFSTNEMIVMNNNGFSGKTIENEPNRCTNSSTNKNNHNNTANGTNIIHNGIAEKNGEWTTCDMEFLNSPAEDVNERDNNNGKIVNSIMTTTVSNETAESMISAKNNSSNVLGAAELLRMFPTPPSLEGMVASPCSTYVATETANKTEKIEQINTNHPHHHHHLHNHPNNNQILNINIEKIEKIEQTTIVCSSDFNDIKESALVYMPPKQSIFITSNKYAPLENIELKSTLPNHFHYKHNINNDNQPIRNQQHNQSSINRNCNISPQQNHHHYGHHHHHHHHPQQQQQQQQQQINPHNHHQAMFLNKSRPQYSLAANNLNNKINPLPFPNSMIRGASRTNCQNPMIPMSPHPNHPVHRIRNQINISQQQHHYPPTNMMDGGGGFNTSPMIPMGDNRRSPFMFGQQQPPSLNSPSNPNLIMNNGMGAVVKQNLQSSMMNGPSTNLYHHTMNSNQNMDSTTAVTANMMQPIANECNSLMLNLLLSDSMFNLFRDHNFESCSICVCNMNIKGNDVGIYLPDSPQQSTNYEMCTCGFSAITNRHRSNFSGLFYEDEVEITGIYYDPIELSKENVESSSATTSLENYIDREVKKCLNDNDENFLKLILQQSTTIYPSLSTLSTIMYSDRKPNTKVFNLKDKNVQKDPSKLIYDDCSAVILASLQMTRFDLKQNMLMPTFNQNFSHNKPLLHEWQFKYSKFPVNNHEVMLTLKRLHPLMQESVQRKGSVNEVTYNNVIGPLTWRQFHRLASRGTECQCEPQPIPSLMVGYDKECVALSPFGLKFWEKLSLEPYAITRDVYYVVITPNEEHNLPIVKSFFKELSTTYEILRLGRHSPLSKISADGGKDGIHMLGVENKNEKYDFQMDDWFNQLGESNLANHLRSYAQAIYDLLPFLNITERGHFDPKSSSSSSSSTNTNEIGICNSGKMSNNITVNGNASNSYVSNSQSMLASSTSSTYHSQTVNQQKQSIVNNNYNSLINNNTNNSENQVDRLLNDLDGHGSNNNQNPNHNNNMDNCNNHGNQNNNNLNSNASFQPYDEEEDPHKYPSIVIYVLESFSSLDKDIAKLGAIGLLKTFSIMKKYFPEPIRNNIHMQMLPKNSIICNDKDFRDYPREPQLKELSFSVYSLCKQQLVMQSNIKSLTGLGPAASFEKFLKNKTTHLYRTPLHTSPYILAPMKDKQTELGEMFGDRRERTQILYCSYCLTEDKKWLIASCTNDKGDILHTKVININIPNRTRRKKASARRLGLDKLMRFIQTVMSESILPWRLIIGRVGRIGHGELKDWTFLLSKKSLLKYSRQLREMCDQCRHLNPNEQPAIYSACLISLEADTALRVFPNYYTPDEKFSSSCNLSTPEDASCTHILVFPTSATTQSHFNHPNLNNIESDLGWLVESADMPDEMDFLDFLVDGDMDGQQPDSPGGNRHQTLFFNASNSFKNTSLEVDQDEPAQLLQQPLALAFYVSTAKIGPLPRWFWAHCPHLENLCPVFLKSALLIHTPSVHSNSDDILQTNNRDCHSLDSNLTNDVLRYSLEGYNALSWLVLDPVTNDRLSCLPLHIQVMMQLYHTIQTLVQ